MILAELSMNCDNLTRHTKRGIVLSYLIIYFDFENVQELEKPSYQVTHVVAASKDSGSLSTPHLYNTLEEDILDWGEENTASMLTEK